MDYELQIMNGSQGTGFLPQPQKHLAFPKQSWNKHQPALTGMRIGNTSLQFTIQTVFPIIANFSEKVNRIFSGNWGKTVRVKRKFFKTPVKFGKNPEKALVISEKKRYSLAA